ncbi:MAG: hypothetical protein K9J30_01800 [Bacteroidales bacterium]|nr:hypothetical protein [Bacteroidales bacterium]
MKIPKYILVLLLVFSNISLSGQAPVNESIRVRIPMHERALLDEARFEFYRENFRNDSLDIEVTKAGLTQFKKMYPGLKLLPDAPLIDDSDMAGNLDEAMTFTKYPTYEQYDSMMHYFASSYPEICKIDTFGFSLQGRLLLALKISDNVHAEEDEPAFLYTSTIHGDELIGYILTLRLIDFILKNHQINSEAAKIVDGIELWINPLSNPDATYYPDDNSSVTGSRRTNISGYDLNRNFPDPAAGDANDTAGIQLENQWMMLFMQDKEFNLSANLHSGAEVVNYPWDHKSDLHPDNDWFILISREYADEATLINPAYMDEFTDGITNGYAWYDIYGGRQDYVTYYLQGRELTLELSNVKKVPSENLETYWNYNKWSLINLITQAKYGIHGNITSNKDGSPVRAKIRVDKHDDSTSWVQSDSISGNFYRYIKEGIYDLIIEAEGFIPDTIRSVDVADYKRTGIFWQLESVRTDSSDKNDTTAINIEVSGEQFRVYPVPAEDFIRIELNTVIHSQAAYMMISASGTHVFEGKIPRDIKAIELDVSELKPGFYIIYINEANNLFRSPVLIL